MPLTINTAAHIDVVVNGQGRVAILASEASLVIDLRVHRQPLLRIHYLRALYAAFPLLRRVAHATRAHESSWLMIFVLKNTIFVSSTFSCAAQAHTMTNVRVKLFKNMPDQVEPKVIQSFCACYGLIPRRR